MENNLVCLLVITYVYMVYGEVKLQEPECSKFDFEYKIVQHLVQLEEHSKALVLKYKDLEEKILFQNEELETLKSKAMTHAVFAEMRLPAKKTFAVGDTIIFTDQISNVGNAYHTDFGFFQPPFNGVYSFSATLCTGPNTWIIFGLVKDDEVMDSIIVGDPNWHQCGTSTAVTYATISNKIWVKIINRHNGVIDKDYGISSFSGVLLYTMSPYM